MLAVVLIVSGALGLRLGLAFADWQIAVEAAQVVGGLVSYPSGNPYYVYQTKLWTVLHQVCALGLWAGFSEIALSRLLSAVMGMLALQVWALGVYALGRDALVAIGSSIVIFLSRAAEFGVVYPIRAVGTSDTWGVVGLAVPGLVAGLLGAERYRAAAFLVGLAPAVHASIGLWLWLIIAMTVLWQSRRGRGAAPVEPTGELRTAGAWLAAGCAVTALSLLGHLRWTYDVPGVDEAVAHKYVAGFVAFSDGHRQPVAVTAPGVALNAAALALTLGWLRRFAGELPCGPVLLLRFVAVTAVLSFVFAAISWIPPDRMPTTLLMLMPSRLLNLNVLLFAALVFGLAAWQRRRAWSRPLVLVVTLALAAADSSRLWTWRLAQEQVTEWNDAPWIMLAAAGVLLVAAVNTRSRDAEEPRPGGLAAAAIYAAIAACYVAGGVIAWDLAARQASRMRPFRFHDRTNDRFFSAVAAGKGLLLTGGDLGYFQLRTRRPVLLNGLVLDQLPYAPESAPAIDRIMREVYGVDLLNPPEEARGSGRMPLGPNRQAWERFTPERWAAIGREYGVTGVVALADWRVKLRPIAHHRREGLTLYEIPP